VLEERVNGVYDYQIYGDMHMYYPSPLPLPFQLIYSNLTPRSCYTTPSLSDSSTNQLIYLTSPAARARSSISSFFLRCASTSSAFFLACSRSS
jgi:hypothetical protein